MKRFSSILLIVAIAIPVMAADTAKPNLSGKWVLNEKESDQPKPPAIREGMPPRPEGFGPPPGGPGRGMRRPPRERAERFSIEQTGDAVTFHYADGWSRTLRAGEAKSEETSMTARWEGSKLVTSRLMGPKVTETYEVSSDRSRLTITTIVTLGDGETTTIKRVYDAAK
jgi:hypothetical protein